MDGATLQKIQNLREVAAQLRTRAAEMAREDYIAHMLKGAAELEGMANWLAIGNDPADVLQRRCA